MTDPKLLPYGRGLRVGDAGPRSPGALHVIDKHHAGFLNFTDFGVRGEGGWFVSRALLFSLPLIAGVVLGGCAPGPVRKQVEDSLTTGRITVVGPAEAEPLLAKERAAFQELYPGASVRSVPAGSREAVRCLFAAECDLAALSRDLTPEERAAALRGGLSLEGYRFAKDAVVVVVHRDNPTENLALDVLKSIYEGEVTNWSELGAPALEIQPVFPPVESDMAGFFGERVMQGQPVRARVLTAATDSAVVAAVGARPGAVGLVSLAWAGRGAKALRISGMTGLPYFAPDLEAVYRGEYPLTRSMNFYVRETGPKLAHGFITYVTSGDGQKLVHEAGLVPTSVPVRFVRRSPLRGAH